MNANDEQERGKAMNRMIKQTAGKGTGAGQLIGPCPAHPVSLSGNAEQVEAQPAGDASHGGVLRRRLAS
jgi:hypothetical protein